MQHKPDPFHTIVIFSLDYYQHCQHTSQQFLRHGRGVLSLLRGRHHVDSGQRALCRASFTAINPQHRSRPVCPNVSGQNSNTTVENE